MAIILTPKTEDADDEAKSDITLKQLIVRFIICAILLIGASICLTYVVNSVSDKLNLGKTFAGALLLGLVTSLPELVSTVSLCRRGNFNASIGNILGSNIFNFFILFLADLLSFTKGNTNIYPYFKDGAAGMQSMLLLVLGAAASVFALIMIAVKSQAPQKKLLGHVTTISSGTIMTAAYILFLALSTTLI